MTTIPSIEPATCSPAAGAPHVDAAASLPSVGPRACASEPLRSFPGAPRACASEPLRSLHAAALPFARLLSDNATLQTVLESIVAAPLSPTPSPERSVEASAPPTLAVPSAPPALVGGDVLGAPCPGAEVPPAESSPVVSPGVPVRPDAAVEDGSSVAARRGRRALPSEGTVQKAASSTMLAVPPAVSTPSAPSALPAPPALVGGDVLGAPRPGAEVPPAESSSVVSPVVSTRPDVAVVDGSSVAARRGRRALPSEGAVQKAASFAPSAPSASSAPPTPSALPVSLAVPEISTPAAAPTAAPVTAVEAVVAAYTPSAARAVEPAQVLVEAARAVADTLLVTPGLLRGEGEIRIQLRPDVLDGTEIHIVVAGRQLTVAFTPPTPDLVALIEQSRPQLTAHLAERIHSFQIAVDVRRRVRSEERG